MVSKLEILEFMKDAPNYISSRKELRIHVMGGKEGSLDVHLFYLTRNMFLKRIKSTIYPIGSYQMTKKSVKYLEYLAKRSGKVSFIVGNPKADALQNNMNRKFWRPSNIPVYDGLPLRLPNEVSKK